MATVQFFGIEQVMDAAENLNCPAWGIFISRALFTKYESDNVQESLSLLNKNLEALSKSGTTGIYTLKFFECDAGKTIKINERTVCDGGSFNFKLIEPEEREARMIGNSSQYGVIKQMQDEIQELKKQRDEAEAALEDDEPETIGSIVMGLIKNPNQLGQLINIGRSILGYPVQQLPEQASSIGAIPMNDEGKEKDLERLSIAIDTLEKHDPRLVDHLEKLAKMATDNPEQFKTTVSMLDLKM